MGFLDAAVSNLLTPMILAFALGLGAGLLRSDLTIPEAIGKAMAVYLMFAIGLKGGVAVHEQGVGAALVVALVVGALLSFVLPFLAVVLIRILSPATDLATRAAVAAHYGSISVVTFLTASEFLRLNGMDYEGFMVAVVALMETPAIIAGLWIAHRGGVRSNMSQSGGLYREILLNGSVVLLLGAFVIGWIVGPVGSDEVKGFFDVPFKGVLTLFLLDMGLLAAMRIRQAGGISPGLVAFGVVMPLASAAIGGIAGALIGLSVGGTVLLAVLAASASYIAVPAAMRLALPQANPGVYVTLSLAVTFPFNVVIGIPLYLSVIQSLL
ncbi:MAG: sodium-dependent bicarbonate transport family permease [Alphaproteobacteria bacterium]